MRNSGLKLFSRRGDHPSLVIVRPFPEKRRTVAQDATFSGTRPHAIFHLQLEIEMLQ